MMAFKVIAFLSVLSDASKFLSSRELRTDFCEKNPPICVNGETFANKLDAQCKLQRKLRNNEFQKGNCADAATTTASTTTAATTTDADCIGSFFGDECGNCSGKADTPCDLGAAGLGVCYTNDGKDYCVAGFCTLPKKVGSCDQPIQIFYFNTSIGACDNFSYSGCDGNNNWFRTLNECNQACATRTTTTTTTTTTSTKRTQGQAAKIICMGIPLYAGETCEANCDIEWCKDGAENPDWTCVPNHTKDGCINRNEPNKCTCHNGSEATGAACTTNGARICVSCATNYRLESGLCHRIGRNGCTFNPNAPTNRCDGVKCNNNNQCQTACLHGKWCHC